MALRAIARGVSGQTGPAFTALGASGPIGVSEASPICLSPIAGFELTMMNSLGELRVTCGK